MHAAAPHIPSSALKPVCLPSPCPSLPPPGLERFANVPDEERLAELETLRDYLKARAGPGQGLVESSPVLQLVAPQRAAVLAACTPASAGSRERRGAARRCHAGKQQNGAAAACCPVALEQEAVEAVDKAAQTLAAPGERLKKLLEAKDKKAMLLEMAGGWGWRLGRPPPPPPRLAFAPLACPNAATSRYHQPTPPPMQLPPTLPSAAQATTRSTAR